jgi:hypothetical protein
MMVAGGDLKMLPGLGKSRTKLGSWIDKRGIKQEWLVAKTSIGRNTITWACGDKDYVPNGRTMQKILNALRTVDPNIKADDFWPM